MFIFRNTLLVSLGLGFTLIFSPVVEAATFTVTKTADTADGTCDADCSLREAVIAANVNADADEIIIPAGTYSLDLITACEDNAATGDLDISADLTINGAGPGSTIIDGIERDRVFHIFLNANATSDISVAINDLTVINGVTPDCMGSEQGGGIFADSNVRTINLELNNLLIQDNSSSQFGGGMSSARGTTNILITNSTFYNNTADEDGGGMLNAGDTTIINSTISGNMAAFDGGGIQALFGDLNLRNVTITNNKSDSDENNSGDGGGIRASDFSTVRLRNTIIAGNIDGDGIQGTPSPDCHDADDALITEGFNILGDNSECAGVLSNGVNDDQVGDVDGGDNAIDPLLESLADNGGSTPTHALLEGSPAIDRGNNIEGCTSDDAMLVILSEDQRGSARPVDGDDDSTLRCDIGAFEIASCGDNIISVDEECDDGNLVEGDGCSATCTIEPCGNDELDDGEECDDGNFDEGDGCSATCTLETCGNGVLDPGEVCDDGNATAGDGCSADCASLEVCGNSIVDFGEECDDGNAVDYDGCSTICYIDTILLLGDGGCQLNPIQATSASPAGLWMALAGLFLGLQRFRRS